MVLWVVAHYLYNTSMVYILSKKERNGVFVLFGVLQGAVCPKYPWGSAIKEGVAALGPLCLCGNGDGGFGSILCYSIVL